MEQHVEGRPVDGEQQRPADPAGAEVEEVRKWADLSQIERDFVIDSLAEAYAQWRCAAAVAFAQAEASLAVVSEVRATFAQQSTDIADDFAITISSVVAPKRAAPEMVLAGMETAINVLRSNVSSREDVDRWNNTLDEVKVIVDLALLKRRLAVVEQMATRDLLEVITETSVKKSHAMHPEAATSAAGAQLASAVFGNDVAVLDSFRGAFDSALVALGLMVD